ncbi:MAG: hypothetical protein N2201_00150 [candidate division WOR-3 bacterium]|nr:hypothetical protein [candidate division WOR-3 bacterium]
MLNYNNLNFLVSNLEKIDFACLMKYQNAVFIIAHNLNFGGVNEVLAMDNLPLAFRNRF